MTSEHQPMIDLALRWLPFGGPPPEHILVTFGISASTFYRRILDAERTTQVAVPAHLSSFAREQLGAVTPQQCPA